MTKITTNQIRQILDKYLNDYKGGRIRQANVLFVGYPGYGRNAVISEWLENNDKLLNIKKSMVMMHKNNGCVVNKDENTFWNADLRFLTHPNSVVYLRCLNGGQFDDAYMEFVKMLRDRSYTTVINETYDLKNMFLFAATIDANKDPIPDELTELFDVYEVCPSFKETTEYVLSITKDYYDKCLAFGDDDEELHKLKKQYEMALKIDDANLDIKHSYFFTPTIYKMALTGVTADENGIINSIFETSIYLEAIMNMPEGINSEPYFHELFIQKFKNKQDSETRRICQKFKEVLGL